MLFKKRENLCSLACELDSSCGTAGPTTILLFPVLGPHGCWETQLPLPSAEGICNLPASIWPITSRPVGAASREGGAELTETHTESSPRSAPWAHKVASCLARHCSHLPDIPASLPCFGICLTLLWIISVAILGAREEFCP